jgi:LPXTG-motif cell wall-anchored protein
MLMGSGMLLLLLALALWVPVNPVAAQSLPERPSLTPVPSGGGSNNDDDDDETPAPTGRITGTVINLANGAPTTGVRVTVGDATITTDSNGNYDRSGLAAGTYTITLIPPDGSTAAQGSITVTLDDGETEVVHLAFTPAATAVPVVPTAAPVIIPQALPATSGDETSLVALLMLGLALLIGGGVLIWQTRQN